VARLPRSLHDGLIGQRVDANRVFEQPQEQKTTASRPAAIETEAELVEVVVEMLWADCALVSADQPALEQ